MVFFSGVVGAADVAAAGEVDAVLVAFAEAAAGAGGVDVVSVGISAVVSSERMMRALLGGMHTKSIRSVYKTVLNFIVFQILTTQKRRASLQIALECRKEREIVAIIAAI